MFSPLLSLIFKTVREKSWPLRFVVHSPRGPGLNGVGVHFSPNTDHAGVGIGIKCDRAKICRSTEPSSTGLQISLPANVQRYALSLRA